MCRCLFDFDYIYVWVCVWIFLKGAHSFDYSAHRNGHVSHKMKIKSTCIHNEYLQLFKIQATQRRERELSVSCATTTTAAQKNTHTICFLIVSERMMFECCELCCWRVYIVTKQKDEYDDDDEQNEWKATRHKKYIYMCGNDNILRLSRKLVPCLASAHTHKKQRINENYLTCFIIYRVLLWASLLSVGWPLFQHTFRILCQQFASAFSSLLAGVLLLPSFFIFIK